MQTFYLGSSLATILPYKNIYPIIDSSVLICDGARIIGDIVIQENSSIWYNAILRGDVYQLGLAKNKYSGQCNFTCNYRYICLNNW